MTKTVQFMHCINSTAWIVATTIFCIYPTQSIAVVGFHRNGEKIRPEISEKRIAILENRGSDFEKQKKESIRLLIPSRLLLKNIEDGGYSYSLPIEFDVTDSGPMQLCNLSESEAACDSGGVSRLLVELENGSGWFNGQVRPAIQSMADVHGNALLKELRDRAQADPNTQLEESSSPDDLGFDRSYKLVSNNGDSKEVLKSLYVLNADYSNSSKLVVSCFDEFGDTTNCQLSFSSSSRRGLAIIVNGLKPSKLGRSAEIYRAIDKAVSGMIIGE